MNVITPRCYNTIFSQKVEVGFLTLKKSNFSTENTHRSKQYGSIWNVHVDDDVGPGFRLGLFQNFAYVCAIALADEYLSRHIFCYFMQYILHF